VAAGTLDSYTVDCLYAELFSTDLPPTVASQYCTCANVTAQVMLVALSIFMLFIMATFFLYTE